LVITLKVSWSAYDTQVAQVINTHAGSPESEVARVLTERLRGMGVNPNVREVASIAETIAKLPQLPRPPKGK
jgi:IS1 family transposase